MSRYCTGDWCNEPNGEVRLLPTKANNATVVCKTCFNGELRRRRIANEQNPHGVQLPLPNWNDLEVFHSDATKSTAQEGKGSCDEAN